MNEERGLATSSRRAEAEIEGEAGVKSEIAGTGVPGLDNLLGGGFRRGHLILLAGNPGSGKTTLAAQFVHHGALNNEPGVFVSFVEPKEDFYNNMKDFSFNFEYLEDKGLFSYIEVPSLVDAKTLGDVLADVLSEVARLKARRLVIDSISAITSILTKPETRSLLHTGLLRPLKASGVTTVLVAELPYGSVTVGHGIEEFVVDDVLILESHEEKGLLKRVLRIPKSRGVKTSYYYSYEFVIGANGVNVMLPLDPMFRGGLEVERAPTGIKGLDEALKGGFRYNSSVLVVGPEGSGKTMLAITMACNFAMRGDLVVYISLEEPREQIIGRILDVCRDETIMRNIKVYSTPPNAYTLGQWFYNARRANEKYKPRLVIMDGIASLEKHFGEEQFLSLVRDFILLGKGSKQVFLMTATPRIYDMVSTLSDVVITLDFNYKERTLRVVKYRGSECDLRPRRVVITREGVRVMDPIDAF